MLNKVTQFKVTGPHALQITFSDGAVGVHDFKTLVNDGTAIAEPLRDAEYFARVFLEFGALTWPNSYDMCPDWLRMEMEKAGEIREPGAAA